MQESLVRALREGASFTTLEITPAKAPSITPLLDRIEQLGLHLLVDGFSVTDNPLAKLKYSPLFAALRVQQRFGKPTLATLCMRDRNKIALQSDLLGANDLDVRTILALTGDPAHMSDQPHTKGVFEGDSTLLLEIIRCFNAGIDFAGREFKERPRPIYPFAVINSYAKNFSILQKKMRKKIEHGALGIITQPVFDLENARKLLEVFKEAKKGFEDERGMCQLILGIFPVTRYKTAQFLASHVPGIYVPKTWEERLYQASMVSESEEQRVGMEMSRRLLNEIRAEHGKIHLMAANRFEVVSELLQH